MAEETTQTQIQREAPFMEDYRRRLLESTFDRADVAQEPPAYQVAALPTETDQARQLIQSGLGAYSPYLTTGAAQLAGAQTGLAAAQAPMTAAQAGITGAALPTAAAAEPYISGALTPIQAAQLGVSGVAAPYITGAATPLATAQNLATQAATAPTSAGIAQYMSPYQTNVTQEALTEMQRQADLARNRLGAEAVGAGAYGGARMGVQGAELERNLADMQSRRIFEDLQTNYGQALGAYQQQQQAELGAAQGLGGLGVAQAGLGRELGSLYGQLGQLGTQQAQLGTTLGQLGGTQTSIYGQLGGLSGEQARQAALQAQIGGQQAALGRETQQLGQQEVQPLFQIGDVYQQQQQRELEAQRQSVLEQQGEPYQRLLFTSDILAKTPSAYSTVGVTRAPTPSPIAQSLGLGIGALGAYGAYKQGMNPGGNIYFQNTGSGQPGDK